MLSLITEQAHAMCSNEHSEVLQRASNPLDGILHLLLQGFERALRDQVKQVLFALDVVVERGLLHTNQGRERPSAGGSVTLPGKQFGRGADELAESADVSRARPPPT